MRTVMLACAGLAALGLAACQEGGARGARASGGGVGGICKPFTAASASTTPGALGTDPAMAVDDCLHRWGYTLARSNDPADVVGRAVAAACAAPLSRWNQQTRSMGAVDQRGPCEAPSLLSGEPTTPIGAHAQFVDGRALFYVVQARAGKCDPPKVDRDAERKAAAAPAAPA
jgi:hypothetical protein